MLIFTTARLNYFRCFPSFPSQPALDCNPLGLLFFVFSFRVQSDSAFHVNDVPIYDYGFSFVILKGTLVDCRFRCRGPWVFYLSPDEGSPIWKNFFMPFILHIFWRDVIGLSGWISWFRGYGLFGASFHPSVS